MAVHGYNVTSIEEEDKGDLNRRMLIIGGGDVASLIVFGDNETGGLYALVNEEVTTLELEKRLEENGLSLINHNIVSPDTIRDLVVFNLAYCQYKSKELDRKRSLLESMDKLKGLGNLRIDTIDYAKTKERCESLSRYPGQIRFLESALDMIVEG